jgi:hypothetical protein
MIEGIMKALLSIFQEIEDPIVPRKMGLKNNSLFLVFFFL